jgi:hypothetical protein
MVTAHVKLLGVVIREEFHVKLLLIFPCLTSEKSLIVLRRYFVANFRFVEKVLVRLFF